VSSLVQPSALRTRALAHSWPELGPNSRGPSPLVAADRLLILLWAQSNERMKLPARAVAAGSLRSPAATLVVRRSLFAAR
jgi:hypothetical protein